MEWTINDTNAELHSDPWSIKSDLAKPTTGWELQLAGDNVFCGLLALKTEPAHVRRLDTSCRQSELVSEYQSESDTPFTVSLSQTILQADAQRLVIELVVSLNTRSFEQYPSIAFSIPTIQDQEFANVNLWKGTGVCGAIVVETRDLQQCEYDQSASAVKFFGEFLERGVIRKCRLRLIVATESGHVDAENELKKLGESPLPLLA